MTKRVLTQRVVQYLFAALALAVAAVPAAAQTKWNLPAAYAANNYHSENLVWFAEEVKKATGGQLEITVHPGASLFKAPEIKRAVATGQAQMGEILISIHENEDPIFGLDTIPFTATSFKDAYRLWQAQKPAMAKKLDSQGIMLLYSVAWGPQGLYVNKEVNSIDDMKGLKMRAYNVGTSRIAELVGAQAVTVQAAELPQALATGTVNAFITSGSTGYDSKAWETVGYFYDCQAWIPKNVIMVGKAAFNSLPKDQQEAVLKAAAAAETRGWQLAEDKASWYLDQLKAKGMKVLPPSDGLNAGLKKLGDQLVADWEKRASAEGKEALAAYRK
ncbi:MAG: C4-dicarboxylate ABC transporter substrate-binding protein [Hyphomicrobiales bacterium]|nr:MAG: C4-dicarboxylate ABC transporter substrate-binding protein [Hyphomicrobiales bacterium]